MTVNIYIYQTIKGPGTRAGSYTYILEADVNGKVATLTSTDTLEPMTEKKAELTVILKALKRLVKDCDVMIVGCSAYLITAINQWLDNWENSNWKNAKGKEIANKEEWQELLKYIRKYKIIFVKECQHEYLYWIKSETDKQELKRKDGI